MSLGVGDNPAKRIADPFEENCSALLAARGVAVCIDKGAGGEEAARVERAVERSGVRASFWDGSFAGFAAIVAGSRLYVGYDSAGQHVAAACGVAAHQPSSPVSRLRACSTAGIPSARAAM